ncbi:hypothetical protein [Sphingomonas beigongshangi]|uniref:hypothetical protein n=1 Tax=Sphingomonas beigongshangi TaxID=2782540 RepID=UPI00193BECE8|nr:hypothetical protein [Sphingomonas beigongshangi]
MTSPAFTHVGKQVMSHGYHYADAADEKAAERIALALNIITAFERVLSRTEAPVSA